MSAYLRIATIAPRVAVANPQKNAQALLKACLKAEDEEATIVLTPELALTGATCGDLFETESLITQTADALAALCKALPKDLTVVVGLPIRMEGRLYSAAAVIQQNRVCGYVIKDIVTKRVGSQVRYFSSAATLPPDAAVDGVPCGADLLFTSEAVRFGISFGQDLFRLNPRTNALVAGGAQLILLLDAQPTVATAADAIATALAAESRRAHAAYAYVSSGEGESTTDAVFTGRHLMAWNGSLVKRVDSTPEPVIMAFSPRWADALRQRAGFEDVPVSLRRVPVFSIPTDNTDLLPIEPYPFVPTDPSDCTRVCRQMVALQAKALEKRFRHVHANRLVIGLSGGLDSTLALMVCAQMCRNLGLPPHTILGITMPGFGTSARTRSNVDILAESLQIELREISIVPGVEQHFRDIGHDSAVLDVTYENAQARARTYLLMDIANQEQGLLVGTGDLSEIALGWSTYNGDHMSMYSVNCGVPKTLIRPALMAVAETSEQKAVLDDICQTPVSPELLPGEQHTEALVGCYDLHDFYLYYFLKYGCDRDELARLAETVFEETYSDEIRDRTLEIFCKRFVQQQFKRSASPDGPKVLPFALSPRTDWFMPSDAELII